ncbi:MAG: PAS domain-containing sensor histidine kinase [Proteobacteria bacterium]|nr:PAS domain-containing sensor histidine kinase [Pseudomonadota bacterium]
MERLRALLEFLRTRLPDPGKTGLSWWLTAMQLAVVVVVAAGLTWYASGMLRDLADQQAKARALLAASTAREDLRRSAEEARSAARSLADDPTLQRLLAQGQREALPPVLKFHCDAAGIDACAVLSGPSVVAVSGPALDWAQIVTAASEQGATFLALPAIARVPLLGARAPLAGSDQSVYVARRLDEHLAHALGEQVGMEVRLVDYRTYTGAEVSAFTPLYAAALADGRSAVMRIDSQKAYAACVPVYAVSGEAVALLVTLLPVSAVDAPEHQLVHKLLVGALLLAIAAIVAGMLLGERVASPVRALTAAAARLGAGDFSASIPPGGPAEVGTLARTMEDMRRNLIELTGALRRREAEAQAVLGGIVEGVYAVDKNRIIRYLNPQAARLLGVEAGEAVGRFCGDVLRPRSEDGRRPCETRCPILAARGTGSVQALEILSRGGEPRHTVIISAAPAEGMQVQVMRDETELEAVRRARDSILANISHEFRTPLAAQMASIELLAEGLDTLPPDKVRELVATLERGTVRLTQLIDNLLESVRIESGQLAIRVQRVALAEVVEDAEALVGALLAQRGQRLEIGLPEELPLVNGDRTRLTQVFVNLLANANKYAPEDSTVRIGAQPYPAHLEVWVEDEGPGPDPADQPVLFARFARGLTEPEPAGLGLGLWLVKSIIERHGGSIRCERTPQSRTRFTMTLPMEN